MLRPAQTHPDSYREKINIIPPAFRQTGMTIKKQ